MSKLSKKRKIIGKGFLAFLIVLMFLIMAFNLVAGHSRSVGDAPFSKEQQQEMRQELIKQGLPASQREARELIE